MILTWPKIALLFLSYHISCIWRTKIQLGFWLLKKKPFYVKEKKKSYLSSLKVLAPHAAHASFSSLKCEKIGYPGALRKVIRKRELGLEFMWILLELQWCFLMAKENDHSEVQAALEHKWNALQGFQRMKWITEGHDRVTLPGSLQATSSGIWDIY